MTLQINGTNFGEMIEIASIVGSIAAMLVVALVIYLVVRPPRRRREVQPEPDAVDAGELLALIDRMERRLEVLERAVGDETKTGGDRVLEAGEVPEMRRVK